MMKLHEYPEIGEKLYSTVLPNGLEIRVIPKKDFSTCYAAFMTNYGGAHRRFTVDGRTVDTPAGVALAGFRVYALRTYGKLPGIPGRKPDALQCLAAFIHVHAGHWSFPPVR